MTTHTPSELTRIRQLARGDCVQFEYADAGVAMDKFVFFKAWNTNGALRGLGQLSMTRDGHIIKVMRL